MHKRPISVLALCLGELLACDSSKRTDHRSDAGGSADAGNQADVAGPQPLCAAAANWTKDAVVKSDFKAALCRFTGFYAAAASGATSTEGLKASCTQGHDDCVADKEVQMPFGGATCVVAEPCDITAVELQACVSDWVEAMKASFLSFPTCEALAPKDLEAEHLERSANLYHRPQSCGVIESKCPALLL